MEENLKSEDAKRFFKWGGWVLVILAVFLGVETLSAFKNLSGSNPAHNSISVSGEGEVVSIPDVASFYFTVSADASTVSAAQEAVTTKMNAILAALKAQGIEDRDIKTNDYSVYPRYRFETASMPCSPTYCPPSPGGNQVADGYTASQNVSVKVRKTEEAGKALAAAGENGATGLSGLSFTTDDPEQAMEEARALAIEDARAKAKVLAKDLGVRLGKVVSYAENNYGYPMPMYRENVGGSMDTAQSSAPTLPQGENKVSVRVTVEYEIK